TCRICPRISNRPFSLVFTPPSANQFAGVKITTVQSAGTLHVGEMEIHAGDFVMQAEITAGNLTFEPLKDANGTPYTSFTFQVQDDGGTADGGANLDATPNTVTINVTPINDPPVVAIDSVVDDVGRVIGVNDSVFVGQRIFLTGSFRDPDQPDSHTAGVEWRDGTTTDVGAVAPGQSIDAEHVFVSPSTIGSGFDVQLTVTDGYNTDGSAQRTVRVVVPATGVSDLADGLADLLNNGTLSPAAAQAVQDAIDQLIGNNGGSANNGATDQIDLGNFNAALVKIRAAIEALDAAKAADPSLDFTNEKRILALAGAAVADQAVSNAKNIASTPKDSQNIDAAKALVSQGRALIQSGNFLGSIDLFQDALTWLKSPPKKKASFSVNKLNLEILTISELAKTPLMQFRVSGPAGIQVHLEFSRDLQEWEPVQTIAVPYAGVTEFKIEREEGSLSGFYRLRRTNLNSQ
ncbi:MAG: hypothetical protein O2960_08935, partial [Verrucomicrobia bacterium]|nr:hypothetical protein [Verrucomicrobiota bacterium]